MPENKRLFIAAFPPPALRQALFALAQQQHRQQGGRCMPQDSLHLTLTFLGQTPNAAIPDILAQLQQMPALDCEFSIDTLGTFAHAGIVWAGCAHCPASLNDWVVALRARLRRVNTDFDPRPFRPHITLLRKASHIDCALDAPMTWHLHGARLYASLPDPDGPRYEVISSHP